MIDLKYITLFLLIVIPILLIAVEILNRKINKKLNEKTRNQIYLEYLNLSYHMNPERELEKIDKIARAFFSEAFNVDKLSGYSELKEYFQKLKKSKEAEFCERIESLIFSPEPKTKEKNIFLKRLLKDIIMSNKIMNKKISNKQVLSIN